MAIKIEKKKVYNIRPCYQYEGLDIGKHPLICTDIKELNGEKVYEFFVTQSFLNRFTGHEKFLDPNVYIKLDAHSENDGWVDKDAVLNFNQKISIKESQLRFAEVATEYVFTSGKTSHEISDHQLELINKKWNESRQRETSVTLIQDLENHTVYKHDQGKHYAYNTFVHLREESRSMGYSYVDRWQKYLKTRPYEGQLDPLK